MGDRFESRSKLHNNLGHIYQWLLCQLHDDSYKDIGKILAHNWCSVTIMQSYNFKIKVCLYHRVGANKHIRKFNPTM